MDWLSTHEAVVIGVIFMLVLGPAVGNYACSVVYRLPRGQTPFERHPYCGHCGADLQPIDLFPILSWCLTRGKCRYCAGEIPSLYTVIELACAAVFVAYFLNFGIGEYFLLYTAYAVFTLIVAGIQWQRGWVAQSVYSYALLAIGLARVRAEHTIYGWFDGFLLMLVLCVALHMLVAKINATRFDPFTTPWIWWMALMGALLPTPLWPLLLVPVFFLLLFYFGKPQHRALALIPVVACALYLPLVL
ncbi:MAG: prepilin peptidase [Alphaproteobacteria bacterium]